MWSRALVWYWHIKPQTPQSLGSAQDEDLWNPSPVLEFPSGTPSWWRYSWGALYFDSYRNGNLQCQEFKPWGAGDIFGHGAACCSAPWSFTAGYNMLYFISMSGLVAHCTAAVSLEFFESVSMHVEHVTHNPLSFMQYSSWVKTMGGMHEEDAETSTHLLQHMFDMLVLSTFLSLRSGGHSASIW